MKNPAKNPVKIAVGRTTVRNMAVKVKPSGRPAINRAKKIKAAPLIRVPRKPMAITFGLFNLNFLSIKFAARYMNKPLRSLSIMLGTWPPGKVVVRAARIPARAETTRAFFKFKFIKIARNMVRSKKSGFIPPTIPGITRWSRVPIASSMADDVRSLVVIDPPY